MSEVFHKAISTVGLSDQEIFDISLNHMRSQGKPAFDGTKCQYRYRNPQGEILMCAAGPFVEDNVRNDSITSVLGDVLCGSEKNYYRLLSRLQIAHDTAASPAETAVGVAAVAATARMKTVSPDWLPEEWLLRVEAECKAIAEEWGLKYCPPASGEECK